MIPENRYQMIKEVETILKNCGVDVLYPVNKNDELLSSYKSNNEDILFYFYWDSIGEITFPEGTYNLGSLSGHGSKPFETATQCLTNRFGLLLDHVNMSQDGYEKHSYYLAAKE